MRRAGSRPGDTGTAPACGRGAVASICPGAHGRGPGAPRKKEEHVITGRRSVFTSLLCLRQSPSSLGLSFPSWVMLAQVV